MALLGLWSAGGAIAAPEASAEQIARGEYLSRIGNCAGCHTAPGGDDFAGGRAVHSNFGTFYTPNITPDPSTGIGNWTESDFWRALHHGERADGTPLYPACPYPNFTHLRRDDVNAIYAYLQSVSAVRQENPEHNLTFPASIRPLLSAWQALFFEAGTLEAEPAQSVRWNRGAYLVKGLGHCSACHQDKGIFGASLSGNDVPGNRVHGWYAPSLHSSAEAGLQAWPLEKGAALLRHGKAGDATTMGPMADVVFASLQYLTQQDALAMATYLRSLPDRDIESDVRLVRVPKSTLESMRELGRTVYERHCQDCHGNSGQGSRAAPALAGNRAVTLANPTNLVNVIRNGGYPPSTEGNPRPFGMPPFHQLSTTEVAAVVTYIRTSWGNSATPVSTANVR